MIKKRCIRIALLLGLSLVVLAHAADLAEQPKQLFLGGFLKETRVIYPLRLGTWEAQGEHLYDVQELGASVRYQSQKHQDRWIDLYFYPAGALPASAFAQAVKQTMAELESSATQVGREGFAMDRDGPFKIDLDPASEIEGLRSADGHSVVFRYQRDGKKYHSAMAMTVHDLYFIKARYSVEDQAMTRGDLRNETEAFLGDVVRKTEIVSTGGCWMPLPIEKLAADAPAPTDAQGAVSYKGKPAAYVYQDRIVAHDPESPVARIAMMMIMRENGRFFWGCDAPERIERKVGEGMRELRLEFRDGEGDPDPSQRIHAEGVGVG